MSTTVRSDGRRGLAGDMPRDLRVVFLGAGSFFCQTVATDLFQIPGLQGGTLAMVDIDEERLDRMERLIHRIARAHDVEGWKIEATTDRREVLGGADYLVNSIEVSGLDCVRHDNDIPQRYGVDQCIGDTVGPGGLFKALRTIPAWLDILADAEEMSPDAVVLNYTNPMSMMCLAADRASAMEVYGLCHSVQATSALLAARAGVRYRDLEWACAGINHLAWFTYLRSDGVDLYPRLEELARADLTAGEGLDGHGDDLVRKDMMLAFGAFITESSGHLSEYLPYYRTRADDRHRYLRSGYDGESSFYADNWPQWRAATDAARDRLSTADLDELRVPRSWEYASWIIEAREKGQPFTFHGNVPNRQPEQLLVDNLSADGIVEVACRVDAAGITPEPFGALPPQMAHVCAWNMASYELGAKAAVERDREAAVHALLLDPLTSACCPPDRIRSMATEMFEAEAEFLGDFG